jgi:hypothetical protein
MQETLWGDEKTPQPAKKQSHLRTTTTVIHTASDCPVFGHNWQTIGLSGEKRCTACGIKGYCPGCTPTPPANAKPYFCSRHTPLTGGQVNA